MSYDSKGGALMVAGKEETVDGVSKASFAAISEDYDNNTSNGNAMAQS